MTNIGRELDENDTVFWLEIDGVQQERVHLEHCCPILRDAEKGNTRIGPMAFAKNLDLCERCGEGYTYSGK